MFFIYLSMASLKSLILFLPSLLLYLFIPRPFTYPYTIPCIYFFLVHPVLNFSLSSLFCFSIFSSHCIFFLIFCLLIICPLIILVFLSFCLFLPVHILQIYSLCCTSAWSIGSYVANSNLFLNLNTRLKLWCLQLQRLPKSLIKQVDKGWPSQGLLHHRTAQRKTHIPSQVQTLDPRFRDVALVDLLCLNSCCLNYSIIQAVCWWQEMFFCVTVFITLVRFCYSNRNPNPLHANPDTFTVHTFLCGHACY